MRTRVARAVTGAAVLITAVVVMPSQLASAAPTDEGPAGGEWTIGYDNQRTNWDVAEPNLSPAAVQASDFGQVFSTTLPGTAANSPNQVYAQPLVVGGRVIVATDDDQVAALDAKTGALDWHVSLGVPYTPLATCGDLVPHIGVTSTPVYDPDSDTVYVAAKTADSAGPAFRLHGLDPSTGTEKPGWPVTLGGTSTNGGETFNAATAHQRAGLLLLGGSVYLAFASHCDHPPYVGYVIGVDAATRAQHVWSSEAQLASSEAGIWQSGGGLVSDRAGQILLTTGNGLSPAPAPGTSPPGNLAESVVRLRVLANGDLTATDFFSPANNAKLDQDDADLGSGAPIALPDSFGTAKYPHLLLQEGKDGVARLLDRDSLGGSAQGPGGTDADLAEAHTQGLWGRFAAFSADGAHYALCVPINGPLTEFRIGADGDGNPNLSTAATGADTFAYGSGSPIVTSDGDDAASSGTAWVVTADGSSGTNGFLRAYALPLAPGAAPIKSFALGTVAKFVQPATYAGRVYVGTRDGRVLAFGRPTTEQLAAPSTEFGQVAVGGSAQQTVTVTARDTATVEAVAASAPFSVDTSGLTFPLTVDPDHPLHVPVTFAPSAAGATSGTLAVTARADGDDDEYDFALHGTGTLDGLSGQPATLDFGDVSTGESADLTTTITNTGAGPATITGVDAPGSPYAVVTAPAPGTVLASQASAPVTVRFSPTDLAGHDDRIAVHADTGSVTIPLAGSGFDGHPEITLDRTALDFGDVAPGAAKTLALTVTNSGSASLTLTKAPPPAAPFSAPQIEGQDIAPGDSLTVDVTFTPTSAEPASAVYSITGGGTGQGAQLVQLTANTSPWIGPINNPVACLQLERHTDLARGAPLTAGPCRDVSWQRFSYVPATQALHYGSATSLWCVDVPLSATATYTKLQFYTCNNTNAQRWVWRADDSLYNPHAGKCLDLPGNSAAASGTRVQLYPCNRHDSQYWDLAALQPARGLVSSGVGAAGQFCVDVRGGLTADHTPVQLAPCTRGAGQIVTHVGSSLRVLGRCLDVSGAGTANGTKIQLYRCVGNGAQQWNLLGGEFLYNVHSGKCLDDPGAQTANVQLEIWTCGEKPQQHWQLPG